MGRPALRADCLVRRAATPIDAGPRLCVSVTLWQNFFRVSLIFASLNRDSHRAAHSPPAQVLRYPPVASHRSLHAVRVGDAVVACDAAQTRRGICRAEEAAGADAGRDVENAPREAR